MSPLPAANASAVQAALERNDRYVREFIEAFNLCPYAKRTRETGRLQRQVLLEEGGTPGTPAFESAAAALDRAFELFERMPEESIDVGLVIFAGPAPELAQGSEGAHAFEALLVAARARMHARHGSENTPFYCVPFHPGFTGDLTDEHRAVRLIRRSPDPTVQLVRASVLRAVRGPGAMEYVNVSRMSAAELMAVSAPLSASERIGMANLRTLRHADPQHLQGLLTEFAAHRR